MALTVRKYLEITTKLLLKRIIADAKIYDVANDRYFSVQSEINRQSLYIISTINKSLSY